MATNYGLRGTSGDDSPYATTNLISTTAGGASSLSEAVVASGTNTRCWLTANGVPNNTNWKDSTTQTTLLDVSVADMNMRGRCKVGRTDGTNTILQEGAFTAYQTFSSVAVYTFSPVSPAWTDAQENAANQFFVVFEFNNTSSMVTATIQYLLFDTGDVTTDSYITADLDVSARRIMSIV